MRAKKRCRTKVVNHILLRRIFSTLTTLVATVRDTVVFSIIDNEWPTMKFALTDRIDREASTA